MAKAKINILENGLLIVDDKSYNRLGIMQFLEDDGWEFREAGDQSGVERLLQLFAFFGACLDGNLTELGFRTQEGQEGLVVAELIRAQDKKLKRHTQLVWYSSSPAPEIIDYNARTDPEKVRQYFLKLRG